MASPRKESWGAIAEAAQLVAGEWFINASILQCHDALLGRLVFTETGDAIYLAAGGELVGRGLGFWFFDRGVVGFQVDIFQYATSSTKHVPTEPTRFRGIAKLPPRKGGPWIGEWYFAAFQSPPRLVGKFQAIRPSQAPPVSTADAAPLEDVPAGGKKGIIAMMDKVALGPPALSTKAWVSHRISGDISDVFYVRNFLEPQQVEEMERVIDKTCEWEHMTTRDTQEFGCTSECPCGRSLVKADLPKWQDNLVLALHNLGIFHPVLFPANSVRLNAYSPGQGIHPHADGPIYYPRAAILSLGSHCVFDFYPMEDFDEEKRGFSWDLDKEVPASPELPPGTKPALSILLEPGSLLIFSGDAFIYHRHGIKACEEDEITRQVKNAKDIGLSEGDLLRRGRRMSLTIRHLLPRCMCTGPAS
uniref:Fe2OG dioxygenase domain-containing protein n=1 Tax=Zooxanthella nutricula TaxID=1333877 RepID=A0A6U8TU10_9DINO